jgi:hypothetical protein
MAMLDKLKAKLKLRAKKYRAPCLCGCGSTSPSTIASHRKLLTKKANLDSLSIARSISRVTLKRPSHRKPRHSVQPVENDGAEDPMEVDYTEASGSGSSDHSSPLTRIWTNRASRHEREDEDLVSEPGSPESSEDEDENDGSLDADEPAFLTDDEEPPVHVEISARDQLTADFQLRATRAGMLLITIIPFQT